MDKQKIKSFTDLEAWKESHKLVLMIYEVTNEFPRDEMFALVSQLRRAAISIVSNIAEGFTRKGSKEKIQFYFIAKGSNVEIQSQLLVAKDLKYLNKENFDNIANQSIKANKLIGGLIKYCKNTKY
ncbi:MAG: four helix bundle protein [Patescibacteria group bacterium]|nr:four helix bundle protein [Patescibacteria group bacterium]